MSEPKTVERVTTLFARASWKNIRLIFLKRSVSIPAPIFFLAVFLFSWACFTLYFKMQRTSTLIDSLERRTEALESELESYGDPASAEEMPYHNHDEDFEASPPTQVIEM